MSLLIIDNYDSFTFNLVQCVEQAGCSDYVLVKNDNLLEVDGATFDKVLISPGPGVSSEAGQLTSFIGKHYKDKSFLGICLGFEALLEFFGARISLLPKPMHGIRNNGFVLKKDDLFQGIPSEIKIGHYHSWYVKEEDFPEEVEMLVKDENGLIMAFKHNVYPIYGLHFHPESYMTEWGQKMIENWLNL